jgi:hypothetical protein
VALPFSEGRLAKDWTIDFRGDVGIVETLPNPISSALLTISGTTGTVRYRTPFPESSSTINGFRCQDPIRNVLTNIRPSRAGSVFTNTDGNMYLQVEMHVESTELEACKGKQYSFDDTLALLRVSPDGEAEWKTFERIHADGAGDFTVQARVFAGETIPDGLGGVLAAWTYGFPGTKEGEKAHFEARLSRIGDKDQADFTLPMPFWTPGITSLFDGNGSGRRRRALCDKQENAGAVQHSRRRSQLGQAAADRRGRTSVRGRRRGRSRLQRWTALSFRCSGKRPAVSGNRQGLQSK